MEAYFNDVVDPVMRPLLAKIKKDQPSKEELGKYIIAFMVALEGRENSGSRGNSSLTTDVECVPRAPSLAESKEVYADGRTEPLTHKLSEKQSEKGSSASESTDAKTLCESVLNSTEEESAGVPGALAAEEATMSADVAILGSDALPQAPPGIERDSALAEDAVSLRQLLLPIGYDPLDLGDTTATTTNESTTTTATTAAQPTTLSSFSVAYNRSVLEGWVKQPSPCCGAAAVAGAWNACLGYARDDPRAESHLTTVPVFAALLQDQADAIRGRFERLLGASLAPLLEALHAALALQGRAIGLGPKKSEVPTKSELLGLVKTIVSQEREKAKRWVRNTGDTSGVQGGMSRGKEGACDEMKEGGSDAAIRAGETQAEDHRRLNAEAKEQEGCEERALDKESSSTSDAAVAVVTVASTVETSTVVYDEDKCAPVFLRLGELMDEDDAIREAKKAKARAGGEDDDENTSAAAGAAADDDDVDVEDSDNDDDDDEEADGAGPSRDAEGEESGSNSNNRVCQENNDNDTQRSGATVVAAESFEISVAKKKKPLKKKSTLGGGGGVGKGKKKKVGGGQSAWAWKKELGDWLHKCGGLAKINNWPRPSTAAFGNWGILGAVRRMASSRFDVDMIAMTFMGKKSRLLTDQANNLAKQTSATSSINGSGDGNGDGGGEPLPPYVNLSRNDSAGAVAAQWSALRSAFGRRDACMVFHLKNHYALVYALREWVEVVPEKEEGQHDEAKEGTDVSVAPLDFESKAGQKESLADGAETKTAMEENDCRSDESLLPPGAPMSPPAPPPRRGRVVRQLLTSRRGQRPSAWIDFDEARETMLGWDGYKLLLVERRA